MRRCPTCQAPHPDAARFCPACGAALASPAPRPWSGGWAGPPWRRLRWAVLPALVFQLSAGGLLGVGTRRHELHFLAFHLVHGLLLGLSLAWLWSEPRARGRLAWAGGGLLGGLLAEGLEVWFTYRHWMGGLSLWVWGSLGLPQHPALAYQILQVLRLAGPLLVLGWVRLRLEGEPGLGGALRLLLGGLAALALRCGMRGAWVAWNTFAALLGWEHALLCALSLLALVWALGPEKGAATQGNAPGHGLKAPEPSKA